MNDLEDATHITNPGRPTPNPTNIYLRQPIIDFDAASAAWMANKIRRGPLIHYRCTAIQKNGHQCAKAVIHHNPGEEAKCKRHLKK